MFLDTPDEFAKDGGDLTNILTKDMGGTVSIGFNEKEQAWYGWTHRGYGKFWVGYEIKKGSIMDNPESKYHYPFKVETLEQAKELAVLMSDYLD